MAAFLTLLSFIITSIAGWLNERQRHATRHALDCLVEEYRVLREQTGDRGLRFPEDLRPNMGNTTIEVVTKF